MCPVCLLAAADPRRDSLRTGDAGTCDVRVTASVAAARASIAARLPWHHDQVTAPAATRIAALAASSHPVPTAAVTLLTTVLVASAGNPARVVVLAAAAVLTGQLAIGWSNDAIDAPRDSEVGRTDKPVARGAVSLRTTWVAAAIATLATVPLSLALGWRAGLLQLDVVLWGGLYNCALKSTLLSAVPFLVAFGGLPAVATLSLPSHRWPPLWTLAAAGLIGVAAHFGNVLPDLDDDRDTGVAGLPHRLSRPAATLAAIGAALLAAGIVVAAQAGGMHSGILWTLAAVAVFLAVAGLVVSWRSPRSEGAFFATMAIAATGVAMIVSTHGLG
jgi:4-hydroxybenzoate polyprenyltransferase